MHRLALVLAIAACGGDDAPATPQTRPAGGTPVAGAPAGAKKKDDKNKLQPRKHVEDNVDCPPPEKSTGPECKPEAPTCDQGTYCIATAQGSRCEACPERDAIRHEFRDRDFAPDQSRDPFESFVVNQGGIHKTKVPIDLGGVCKREDQFVASSYSFQELKLVGIVSQGTQRKVLMTGPGSTGFIIKRADCVGKEKAIVKDIGTGFITFMTQPDPTKGRPPAEYSVPLYPTTITPGSQPPAQVPPAQAPPPTNTPVVAPPQ